MGAVEPDSMDSRISLAIRVASVKRQPHRMEANTSALIYWSERLGFTDIPSVFKEVIREHDSALFNIAWESLQNAEKRER